jgi:hypothetical protein
MLTYSFIKVLKNVWGMKNGIGGLVISEMKMTSFKKTTDLLYDNLSTCIIKYKC